MRFRLTALLALFVPVIIASSGALGYQPRVGVSVSGGAAEVTVNDSPAVKFRVSNGDMSPAQRAEVTANRVRRFAASGADPKAIYAKGSNVHAGVYAGSNLICVATAADAQANGMSALALANTWAANLRRLLAMPPVFLSERSIVVPLGESRRISVGGAALGTAEVFPAVEGVVSSSVAADGRTVEFTGVQVGSTDVEIWVGSERASLSVTVRKYAGSVSPAVFAEVTGSPCPSSLVKYAAEQAALREAVLEPGARAAVESVKGPDAALGAGLSRMFEAAVRITGHGYITRTARVLVQITNSIVPADQPEFLFYSNSPERLERYQTLFVGNLQLGRAARLLYHHQNAMGKAARLAVELHNTGETPATYRISRAAAGPMVDTVLVGFAATRTFLSSYQANASVIERVPPRSKITIVSDLLRNLETSSGIVQIKQTGGGPSVVLVSALPPDVEHLSAGSVAPAPDAMYMLSDHIYPSPVKLIEADYVIGQRWAFISIGRKPIDNHDAQKRLDGNYGVTYDINVRVENPTSEPKKVQVLFDPVAGLAAGVFVINGELVTVKYAKPPNEIRLASYQLQPGEVRSVRITTLPVAGSNYPATLIVRS